MKTKIHQTVIFTIMGLIFVLPINNAYSQRATGYGQNIIKDKFFQKQRKILKNAEELNLSEKQMMKISQLKTNLEKELVMKDAQIEVLNIDLKSMISMDRINMGEVNKLLDQKYELKKSKAKAEAKAYADLKQTLAPDQLEKFNNMREIYKGPYRETLR